jgi:hypothetical protein
MSMSDVGYRRQWDRCRCPPMLATHIAFSQIHLARGPCKETTLTGETPVSHKTPLGIEPGSLMTGNQRVVHWTSETWCECSEITGSQQGSPPAANYVGCEARRRTCSEHETWTEELCEIKWDFHIVGTTAYWRKPKATMINHIGVTNVARQCVQENPGFT